MTENKKANSNGEEKAEISSFPEPIPSANGGYIGNYEVDKSSTPRLGSSFGVIEDEEKSTSKKFSDLIAESTPITQENSTPIEKPKNTAKKPILTVLAVLFVVALGYFGLMAYDIFKHNLAEEKNQKEEQVLQEAKADAIREADNPYSVLVGDVPAPSEGVLKVEVKENQIQAGSTSLALRSAKFSPTINGCELVLATDMCFSAIVEVEETKVDVYTFRDIGRNRFLDNPADFKEIEMSGGTIAAVMKIDIENNGNQRLVAALSSSGTTGFVFIFPENTTDQKAEQIVKAATVI